MIVYLVTDGQETWLFEDAESVLEHIRAGAPGDMYTIEIKQMTDAEIAATPIQ